MSNTLTRLMMVAAAGSTLTLASVPTSDAQSGRPNATAMTCAQVQSMIDQRGAVLLATGPRTFDRYVADRSFCNRTEAPYREYIQTRDSNQCRVRRCVEIYRFKLKER